MSPGQGGSLHPEEPRANPHAQVPVASAGLTFPSPQASCVCACRAVLSGDPGSRSQACVFSPRVSGAAPTGGPGPSTVLGLL